jgi:hypothetical protein
MSMKHRMIAVVVGGVDRVGGANQRTGLDEAD